MAEADKNLKVRIVTEADLAAAKAAEQAMNQVTAATEAQAKASEKHAQALKNQASHEAKVKQSILENTEAIHAERQIKEGVIDATKRDADATNLLTGSKSRLGQAIGALNRAMPGLGSSLRLLMNPYTAVAGVIAALIQKNISLRQEQKLALEQAEKDFEDWARSVQEKVDASKGKIIELKNELLSVGSAAQSVKTDLDAMLDFTSQEEAGDMQMLDAEEKVRLEEARSKFAGNPAALAKAEFDIRKEFTGRRRATKTQYEDARIAAKEKFTQDAAGREAAAFDAATKAREAAESIVAPVSFEDAMAKYDAQTAQQEADAEKLRKEARGFGAGADALKRSMEADTALRLRKSKRGDYENIVRSQLDTKSQANAAARSAQDHYNDLVTSRKSTERELDNDYARRDIRRGQAAALEPVQDRAEAMRFRNDAEKNQREAAESARKAVESMAKMIGSFQTLDQAQMQAAEKNQRMAQEWARIIADIDTKLSKIRPTLGGQ